MAKLYITEFTRRPATPRGPLEAGDLASATDQTPVAISGTHAESAAFAATTKFVRIHTDAICSYVYVPAGGSTWATTNNARLAADQTEYFGVNPGDTISVIANT